MRSMYCVNNNVRGRSWTNWIQPLTFEQAIKFQPIQGHRELMIYPIDPNGETLNFDSLICI